MCDCINIVTQIYPKKYNIFIIMIFLFFVLFLTFNLPAQSNEANIWYFGNGNGLDFNQDTPKKLTNGLFSGGTISTICDANSGNLLFYTDGMSVINHIHKVVKNGNGLLGHATNVIVPYPQKKGFYYIFSVSIDDTKKSEYEKLDTTKLVKISENYWSKMVAKYDTVNQKTARLYYHLVDMNKNNGLGEVILKNQLMYKSVRADLTVARHANGKDFWLITHEFMNNHFRVYLINEKGLQDNFLMSKIGVKLYTDDMARLEHKHIKISANFNHLYLVESRFANVIQVFKFDNKTGKIGDFITLKEKDLHYLEGLEFSPDGSKLYLNFIYYNEEKWQIKQYDLNLKENEILKNGKNILFKSNQKNFNRDEMFNGDMQLAKDGKIYITKGGVNSIGVIENPNEILDKAKLNFTAYSYPQSTRNYLANITHLLPPFYDSIKIGESFQRQILFDTQKSDIKTWHTPILQDIILFLNQNKNTKITIIGHTDNEGNKENNQKLSFQRAKSVADYIISQKIDKNRIKIEGLGDTKPIVENDNEENKTKNRRVEFLIE